MFSMLKVEKVVKPPHKPVIKSHFKPLSRLFFVVIPTKKPIIKHPKTFTIKVAKGKFPVQNLETIWETKNLNMLPTAPPIAMKKIVLSIN